MKFKIENKIIGLNAQTYFIADIGANHDGDLDRAKKLIRLASKAGADAAKFQHFKASTIVSKIGFENLSSVKSHQDKWKKSVFEVYDDASLNTSWNNELSLECRKNNIHFFSSIYDLSILKEMSSLVPAFKIGSGDIDWLEMLEETSKYNKPIIIAAGASEYHEIDKAISVIKKRNSKIALLQCNTNYTGKEENFNHLNLNVIKSFYSRYENIVIGLSDHTSGHTAAVGAVALGAKIIEKHFTDDKSRLGPDHSFAMNPEDWREMVIAVRKLESGLGDGIKTIEENETDSFHVQRRSIRSKEYLKAGQIINKNNLQILRPRSLKGISPSEIDNIIGKKLISPINSGEEITWQNLEY